MPDDFMSPEVERVLFGNLDSRIEALKQIISPKSVTLRPCFHCGHEPGGHRSYCRMLRLSEMPKLTRIVARLNNHEVMTSDDFGYVLNRLNTAENLIDRIKRFQPKVGPAAMTADEVEDLEAWCEWKNARRDELKDETTE